MRGSGSSIDIRGPFPNLLLLTLSVIASLAFAEAVSRYVMPVSYGYTALSLQGEPLEGPLAAGGAAAGDGSELRPDISYRVRTEEFDTVVTHTKEGYRGLTSTADPEVVFIGDSFTYGTGLNDSETIPHLYCQEMRLRCVNLGVPGTGTVRQVERLKHYLQTYGWRPREVKLLFMGMTAALMSGNDLNDNLEEAVERSAQDAETAPQSKGLWDALYARRSWILEHSNLVRNFYYVYAPALRAVFSPEMKQAELQRALAITEEQLRALDELAASYGFDYTIHILHPMQDLMQGSWRDTLAAIEKIAPTDRVYTTAPALLNEGPPEQYFHTMDGHPNAAGAARLAHFIAGQDRAP